jgi:hypothetical protein
MKRFLRGWVACTALAGALAAGGCDGGDEAVLLRLNGTVTDRGTPMAGVNVHLRHRNHELDPGYTLGIARTDASGRYSMEVRAERPGYTPGCDFLRMFIDGYEYFTAATAPIRCVTSPQTIDLSTNDLLH